MVWYGIHGHGLPVSIVLLELLLTTALLAAIRYSPRFTASFLGERLDDGRAEGHHRRRRQRGRPAAPRHPPLPGEEAPRGRASWTTPRASRGPPWAASSVLGTIDDLPEVIRKHDVSLVMLAIMELPAERLRRILALCSGSKAKFKIIPASFTQMDDRISAAMLHDLSPEDLLPRVQVDFDQRGDPRPRSAGAASSSPAAPAPSAARSPARWRPTSAPSSSWWT